MDKAARQSVIAWLMEGDPVIRWQTIRDLDGQEADMWKSEQRKVIEVGWGRQFLENLALDGCWPDGRWTGTVWSLLTLIECGIPNDHQPVRAVAEQFLTRQLSTKCANEDWLISRVDLCHIGFWLRIGSYFLGNDSRLIPLANAILRAQMTDGGWNCRIRNYPKTCHSSFHTTFNVLEGLSLANRTGLLDDNFFRESESRAIEFALAHRLYRSDKTGEVIRDAFTHLTFPSYWHYNVLRGLDYLSSVPEHTDPRLEDPLELLRSRSNSSGRWPVEKRIPGTTLFDMEKFGGESRWNTLRAMRVLKCWESG